MHKPRRCGRPSGTESKYRAIAADIAGKITSGEFSVGKPLPTWSELSKTYNVGLMTVGQAMKVLKLEGHVTASPRQRPVASLGLSLAHVLENSVAVVLHKDLASSLEGNTPNSAMYRGIARAVADPCWTILTLQGTRWRKDFPAGLIHVPLQGLLLLGCPFKPNLFKQYQSLNARFPVVTLDEPSEYLHSVSLDNFAAIRDATLRMMALGHRRIAFVRPYHSSLQVHNIDADSKQRTEAFTATCREAGLTPDQFRIFSASLSTEAYSSALREVVRARPRFTAILAMSLAPQLKAEAQLEGLHIPRDLSIVTLNHSLPSSWTGPAVNFEELGIKGVELIRRKPRTLQHVRIPATWNAGETAGPAPT